MTSSEDRRALELGEKAAEEMHDGLVLAAAAEARKRPTWGQVIVLGLVIGMVIAIVAIVVAMEASRDVALIATEQVQDEKERLANRQLAKDAYEQAQRANKALERRGQKPVDVPSPNEATPANVIASAAVPIVLAELDEAGVSADGIATRVAAYMRQNPVQVSTERLARLIADYLAENPPRRGATGPPISPRSMQMAIDNALAQFCGGTPSEQNPDPCRGEQGEPGLDCAETPDCKGDDGITFTPTSAEFKRNQDTSECEYVVTYSASRGGSPPPVRATVPEEFCPSPAPPEQTPGP